MSVQEVHSLHGSCSAVHLLHHLAQALLEAMVDGCAVRAAGRLEGAWSWPTRGGLTAREHFLP